MMPHFEGGRYEFDHSSTTQKRPLLVLVQLATPVCLHRPCDIISFFSPIFGTAGSQAARGLFFEKGPWRCLPGPFLVANETFYRWKRIRKRFSVPAMTIVKHQIR